MTTPGQRPSGVSECILSGDTSASVSGAQSFRLRVIWYFWSDSYQVFLGGLGEILVVCRFLPTFYTWRLFRQVV